MYPWNFCSTTRTQQTTSLMMDETKHERADYVMQKKYQRHKRYCPFQTLIFSPEQISLDLAPDLSHRDHSAGIAYWSCKFSAASLQYSAYNTLYGAAILLVFSTHTSDFLTFSSFTRTSIVCFQMTAIEGHGLKLYMLISCCFSSSKLGQNWPIYLQEQLVQTETSPS